MIARSFAQHPKILILNDPARGIDVSKKEIYIFILEILLKKEILLFFYLVSLKSLSDFVQK